MWTTAYRWHFFYSVPCSNDADRLRCAFHCFLPNKTTVDNVALLSRLMRRKDDIHCEMTAHNVSLLSVIPGCILPSFK